jgi:hypothetical protein
MVAQPRRAFTRRMSATTIAIPLDEADPAVRAVDLLRDDHLLVRPEGAGRFRRSSMSV